MHELSNCTRCGEVFAKTIRDVCMTCYREEEAAFKIVYRFLARRKNREATIDEIVEDTEVEKELIIKWMKENRLRASQFPNLMYPCEKCGKDIVEGRLCYQCSTKIKTEFEQYNEKKRVRDRQAQADGSVYFTMKHNKD